MTPSKAPVTESDGGDVSVRICCYNMRKLPFRVRVLSHKPVEGHSYYSIVVKCEQAYPTKKLGVSRSVRGGLRCF